MGPLRLWVPIFCTLETRSYKRKLDIEPLVTRCSSGVATQKAASQAGLGLKRGNIFAAPGRAALEALGITQRC